MNMDENWRRWGLAGQNRQAIWRESDYCRRKQQQSHKQEKRLIAGALIGVTRNHLHFDTHRAPARPKSTASLGRKLDIDLPRRYARRRITPQFSGGAPPYAARHARIMKWSARADA